MGQLIIINTYYSKYLYAFCINFKSIICLVYNKFIIKKALLYGALEKKNAVKCPFTLKSFNIIAQLLSFIIIPKWRTLHKNENFILLLSKALALANFS